MGFGTGAEYVLLPGYIPLLLTLLMQTAPAAVRSFGDISDNGRKVIGTEKIRLDCDSGVVLSGMIPSADSFNHRAGAAVRRYNARTETMEMITTTAIAQNEQVASYHSAICTVCYHVLAPFLLLDTHGIEEHMCWMQVFNHYSNLGTGSMIANYGFTYSNNLFTTVTLQPSGPLRPPADLHLQPGPASLATQLPGPASSELLVLHACCWYCTLAAGTARLLLVLHACSWYCTLAPGTARLLQ